MKHISAVVIDDSQDDRYLARRVLSRAGFIDKISEFEDGAAAYELMRKSGAFEAQCGPAPPRTLVLLDINMPQMSGFELLEAIADLKRAGSFDAERSCIVLMLTSSAHFGDREKAMQYDFVSDYIEKPIDNEKLQDVLKRHYQSTGASK